MKTRCMLLLLAGFLLLVTSCAAPSTQVNSTVAIPPTPTLHDAALVAQLKATKGQDGTKDHPYIMQGRRQASLEFSCPDWLVDVASILTDPYCVSHQSVSRMKADNYFILIESASMAVLFQVDGVYPQQKEVVAFLAGCATSRCS
jgi:hypothetical protein